MKCQQEQNTCSKDEKIEVDEWMRDKIRLESNVSKRKLV